MIDDTKLTQFIFNNQILFGATFQVQSLFALAYFCGFSPSILCWFLVSRSSKKVSAMRIP
jgi:hypothetical protein